jgi:uncharacterized membrane protein YfcA
MGFIYFVIVFIATTAGAVAGVGGGVIIKPALDAIGQYNVETIGILASAAVFSMAVVATIRKWINGLTIDIKIIMLAIGSIGGGLLGKEIFYALTSSVDTEIVKLIQASIIVVLMIMILFKDKMKRHSVDNILVVLAGGLILGLLASFLGIGGGPVNVAILYLYMGMDMKKAATGSIIVILLAQAAKLLSVALTVGYAAYDLSMLWYIIPAGILGGFLGSLLHVKINEKAVNIVFNSTVILVIIICLYNIITAII